jgi:hypothetical protein
MSLNSLHRLESNAPADLPVEIQLLLALLRSRWEPKALDEAKEWIQQSAIDWEKLAELVSQERLAPLIYPCARKIPALPKPLRSRWGAAHLANGARNAFCQRELVRVLERLEKAQIPVMLLKGTALLASIYENPALRPMGDLDLFVDRAHARCASEALSTLGYAPDNFPEMIDTILSTENELSFVGSGDPPTRLELHWSLFDSPYYQRTLRGEWLWQSARSATVGTTQSLWLGPEAQLLHLCGHLLLHHQGRGLVWYHDIAEWIVHFESELDWKQLIEQARRSDLIAPVQHLVPQVASLWHAPVPPDVLSHLDRLVPSAREQQIQRWIANGEQSTAQHLWADLRSMAGGKHRLAYVLKSLFPSPDYLMARYEIRSRLWVPFFYPYRWLVGLRKGRQRSE